MNDDSELLRRYARESDEDAFTELVRRQVNFVYSAALRQVNGDAHLAADVTQLVFTDLARKAGQAADHRVLAGWLFTSTRFAAAKLVRGERRRHVREQKAQLMQELKVQAEANARLRSDVAELRQHHERLPDLERENVRLKRAIAETGELKSDDAEFGRLQEEATVLRTRLLQLAKADAARAAAQRNASAEVFDITTLDQTPQAKFQTRPHYPAEMREAGIPGQVVVDFVVDSAGTVQNAYALRSSQREFEAEAVLAVSKWKFIPGKKGGLDVNTHMQVPIVFTLGERTSSGNMKVPETPKPIRHTEPGETFQVDAQRQDPSSNRESAAAGSVNR